MLISKKTYSELALTITILACPLFANADAYANALARSFIDLSSLPSGITDTQDVQDASGGNFSSQSGSGNATTGWALNGVNYPIYAESFGAASATGPTDGFAQGASLSNQLYACLNNSTGQTISFSIPWYYFVFVNRSLQNAIDSSSAIAEASIYVGTDVLFQSKLLSTSGGDFQVLSNVQNVNISIDPGATVCVGVRTFAGASASTLPIPNLPEPGTNALLVGAGLSSIGLLACRRKK